MSVILERGYIPFAGRRRSGAFRFVAIAREAVRQNSRSRLMRFLLYVPWLAVLYGALAFFLLAQATEREGPVAQLARMVLDSIMGFRVSRVLEDPELFRAPLWTLIFGGVVTGFQIVVLVLVGAMVAPGLIADDRRVGAMPLYFSRPVSRLQYVMGKLCAVAWFLLRSTLAPSTALYLVSIAVSPNLATLRETIGVYGRVVAATGVMVIPLALVILALSSVMSRRRYLGFTWFVIWVVSSGTAAILRAAWVLAGRTGTDWSPYVSLWRILATAGDWLLAVEEQVRRLPLDKRQIAALTREGGPNPVACVAILAGISAVSFLVVWWRASSREGR